MSLAPSGPETLDAWLAAVDPAALALPPRLVRRLLVLDRGAPGWAPRPPHAFGLAIGADRLRELLSDSLDDLPRRQLPETACVLALPALADFAPERWPATARRLRRQLCHLQVDAAWRARWQGNRAGLAAWWRAAFLPDFRAEARLVLRQEHRQQRPGPNHREPG